jgi:hypothetical protein
MQGRHAFELLPAQRSLRKGSIYFIENTFEDIRMTQKREDHKAARVGNGVKSGQEHSESSLFRDFSPILSGMICGFGQNFIDHIWLAIGHRVFQVCLHDGTSQFPSALFRMLKTQLSILGSSPVDFLRSLRS